MDLEAIMDLTWADLEWDWPAMRKRCLDPIEAFAAEPGFHTYQAGRAAPNRYWFRRHPDNDVRVLAVAHLDTVIKPAHFAHFEVWHQNYGLVPTVVTPTLDDRLGAHVLLDILPKFGVRCDVLLTEGEESGRSTAQFFSAPKDRAYHWMFQFDRAGDDVVMYEYETQAHEGRLQDCGFTTGIGSFTDICYLNHLGITGFNFGTGYHDNHSARAYAHLDQLGSQIIKFLYFYHQYEQTPMPYVATKYGSRRGRRGYYNHGHGGYNDYSYHGVWDEDDGVDWGPKAGRSSSATSNGASMQITGGGSHEISNLANYGLKLTEAGTPTWDPDKCPICHKKVSDNTYHLSHECLGLRQCEKCAAWWHNSPTLTKEKICVDCFYDEPLNRPKESSPTTGSVCPVCEDRDAYCPGHRQCLDCKEAMHDYGTGSRCEHCAELAEAEDADYDYCVSCGLQVEVDALRNELCPQCYGITVELTQSLSGTLCPKCNWKYTNPVVVQYIRLNGHCTACHVKEPF